MCVANPRERQEKSNEHLLSQFFLHIQAWGETQRDNAAPAKATIECSGEERHSNFPIIGTNVAKTETWSPVANTTNSALIGFD